MYLILDAEVTNYEHLLMIALEAVNHGVDIIQLRDKSGSAKKIIKFYQEFSKEVNKQMPFIINDRVDICDSIDAAGVHLGQDDLSLKYARKILGNEKIIGISCQTFEQAKKAQDEGADYIGFGSVFKTLTKPDRDSMDLLLLEKVATTIKIPVFAIGGITVENIEILKEKGVRCFAVCRAICLAENIAQVTQAFKRNILSKN